MKLPKIEKLPQILVTPERFGAIALGTLIQLPLPELARVYDFPDRPENGG